MAKYIDAHKAIEHIKQYKFRDNPNPVEQGVNFAIRVVCRELTDNRLIPAADVVEVKHGKWIKKTDDVSYWYECSECSERPPYGRYKETLFSDYCPYCGAKMDGGSDK